MSRYQFSVLRTPLLVTVAVIILSGLSSLGKVEIDAAVNGQPTGDRGQVRGQMGDADLMRPPISVEKGPVGQTPTKRQRDVQVYSANQSFSADASANQSVVLPASPAAEWETSNGQNDIGSATSGNTPGVATPLSRELAVPAGHSSLIKTPWFVKQVSVADPEIADVQVVAPDQVLIIGRQVGSTDLALWNEEGQVWQARIYVEIDLVKMSRDLNRYLPGAKLTLNQSQDVVVVTGTMQRAEQAESLHRFLETAGIKFVDMTGIAGVQQVMVKVRVAEASRTALRALGINALQTGDHFFGGSTIGGNPNGIDIGVPGGLNGAFAGTNLPFKFNTDTNIGSAVTLFAGFPNADLQIFLEALEDNQYLRVLSEPTLVAISGEEASFLAGGEFPVPVAQNSTTGGGSNITIEFKEFGVRLRFRPLVLGDGNIRLHVAPEVSDLSSEGSIMLQGFEIPSILTRRAETTLEMKNGQTFAMAGLIDRNIIARVQKVPGLGDLPILGSLFRSVRYERGDTELVVIATVSLVEPMSTSADHLMVPGDAHIPPSDWELFMMGDIEGAGPRPTDVAAHWLQQHGLHRLKGPGSWTSYDQPAASVPASRRSLLPAYYNTSPHGEE